MQDHHAKKVPEEMDADSNIKTRCHEVLLRGSKAMSFVTELAIFMSCRIHSFKKGERPKADGAWRGLLSNLAYFKYSPLDSSVHYTGSIYRERE